MKSGGKMGACCRKMGSCCRKEQNPGGDLSGGFQDRERDLMLRHIGRVAFSRLAELERDNRHEHYDAVLTMCLDAMVSRNHENFKLNMECENFS